MRYIIVNGRNKHGEGECAFCTTKLGQTYTRDLTTGITYHSYYCMDMHCMVTTTAIAGNHVQHVEIK